MRGEHSVGERSYAEEDDAFGAALAFARRPTRGTSSMKIETVMAMASMRAMPHQGMPCHRAYWESLRMARTTAVTAVRRGMTKRPTMRRRTRVRVEDPELRIRDSEVRRRPPAAWVVPMPLMRHSVIAVIEA